MVWIQAVVTVPVVLAAYAWMSAGLDAVLAKLGAAHRVAWIPIYRYVAAAKAAELPTLPVWIARVCAAVGWLVFAVVVFARAADAVAASNGVGTIAGIAFGLAVAGSLVGWIMWIAGASRIEFRLVVQRRLWWLAALMPPLWASVIGFGSSAPLRAGPVEGVAVAAGPAEADDATRAIRKVETPPPLADNTAEEPSEEQDVSHVADTSELREVAMTTEDHDITSEVPRAYSPYDVPPLTPVPLPDPPSPWGLDEDDDATFFAKRRRARWVLRVVGAEEYDLEDITTIGREGLRPIPGVLPIIDDTRTMSKLHARLRREGDGWFVTDLGSTNGTFIRDDGGTELEVKAQSEAKVQGTLLLGDLEAVIIDQREVDA